MAGYFSKTDFTPSTSNTYTVSFWVKINNFAPTSSNVPYLWSISDSDSSGLFFQADTTPYNISFFNGASTNTRFVPNNYMRDINGWYHIHLKVSSGTGTLYYNGESVKTSITVDAQNYNGGGAEHYIHTYGGGLSGYNNLECVMTHFHFIDGTAYDPTEFGSTDSTTGQWRINTNPNVTYGTNGYFILKDSASGTDHSGNGNNFTLTGTCTNTEDNPSNVFATWNALVPKGTFSNGNTVWTSAATGDGSAFSTLGAEAGKYYMECKITNANASGWELGVAPVTRLDGVSSGVGTSTVGGVGYTGDGFIRREGTTVASGLTTFAQNDIISCALDMDTRKVYFYKNGTILNSGTGVDLPSTTGPYVFATGDWYSAVSTSASANFGNGYFGTTAISSEGTNASGIGKFEYDVPTGYTALSTKGLNE